MRAQDLVKAPFAGDKSGFTLLGVLLLIPVILAIGYGVLQMTDNRAKHLRIVRMKSRMVLLERKVVNAATTREAVFRSAVQGPASPLKTCVVNRHCVPNAARPLSFALLDSLGGRVNGPLELTGAPCDPKRKRCPLEVKTTYELRCADDRATSCEAPAEIVTRYTVKQTAPSVLGGRVLKTLAGQASLATSVCPQGEYVTGVDTRGRLLCAPARAALFDAACDKDAAFGMTPEGRLLCQEVKNYCEYDISVALVVDRSGSMADEQKIRAAREASGDFVGLTRRSDAMSVVAFSNDSQVVTGLGKDKSKSRDAIGTLRPGGSTNMEAALADAEQVLAAAPKENLKVIVFLSDGMVTAGAPPIPTAERIKAKGIVLWTIGFGNRADRTMLARIASSPAETMFAASNGQLKDKFKELAEILCRKP